MSSRFVPRPALPATWSGVLAGWLHDPTTFAVLGVVIPGAAAACAFLSPWPTLAAILVLGLSAILWRSPNSAVLILIALMGNAKIHYYTGALTIFPEYPFVALVTLICGLQWLEGRWRSIEAAPMWAFLWLAFAGMMSFVNAVNIPRVFSKESVLIISLLIFGLTMRGIQSPREMRRALKWLEWSALVVSGYAVLQMAGALIGWDTGLHYFEKHGNPDFYYGLGPPVIHQFTKIFRANSFMNDSNILGGYLAAVTPIFLALRLYHARNRKRIRASFESLLLVMMGVSLLLTLSRSGLLAMLIGISVVLVGMRHQVRWGTFWLGSTALTGLTAAASTALGINPLVLFGRLSASLDLADYSNRTHFQVGNYALELFARFPLTGVGLRNFGFYYANEIDPYFPNMIAHNAVLGYLAETGLFGGLAFITLLIVILRTTWRTVATPGLRQTHPELYAWCVGLFGSVVALQVSNLFYDFYLRSFTWVLSGLAIATAQLVRNRRAETRSS